MASEQQFRKRKKDQSSLVPYFQNPVVNKENLSWWVSASACKTVVVSAESHTRKSKGWERHYSFPKHDCGFFCLVTIPVMLYLVSETIVRDNFIERIEIFPFHSREIFFVRRRKA